MKKLFLFALLSLTALYSVEAKKPKQPKVNNIIYMIGDGMGLAHVSMLQIEQKYAPSAFDRAQNIALTKTYSLNNRVTDSAASGTALATGYKTNNSTLGLTPEGVRVESIITKAEKNDFATGIVVSLIACSQSCTRCSRVGYSVVERVGLGKGDILCAVEC